MPIHFRLCVSWRQQPAFLIIYFPAIKTLLILSHQQSKQATFISFVWYSLQVQEEALQVIWNIFFSQCRKRKGRIFLIVIQPVLENLQSYYSTFLCNYFHSRAILTIRKCLLMFNQNLPPCTWSPLDLALLSGAPEQVFHVTVLQVFNSVIMLPSQTISAGSWIVVGRHCCCC